MVYTFGRKKGDEARTQLKRKSEQRRKSEA
jgi:hypothetical protein